MKRAMKIYATVSLIVKISLTFTSDLAQENLAVLLFYTSVRLMLNYENKLCVIVWQPAYCETSICHFSTFNCFQHF